MDGLKEEGEGKEFLQSQISETTECKTAMSAWKAPPPIMQNMMIRLRTDLDRDQSMLWRVFRRLASRDQIRSRSADGVFYGIRKEGRENQADEKSKDGDVNLMRRWLENDGPESVKKKWDHAGVDEHIT